MKNGLRNWQKGCAIALVIAIFINPVLTNVAMAQQASRATEIAEAQAAGKADAEADTNKTIWFIAGCLGGVLGLLISYVYTPTPPSSRVIGKSPEYVAAYSDAYRERAKKIQTDTALMGCGAYAAACAAYYLLIAAASTATE